MKDIKLGDWVLVDHVLGEVISVSLNCFVDGSDYRCIGIKEDATQKYKVITDYKTITKVDKSELQNY